MTAHEREASDPSSGGALVRRPLGQLALEAGLITQEQLASAIADIRSRGPRLREVLIARGLLDEAQLAHLLELQEQGGPVPRLGLEPANEDVEEPARRERVAVPPSFLRPGSAPGGLVQ
jgi:hypothetical protein